MTWRDRLLNPPDPVIEDHRGILVVRDDLLPGGTKSRYLRELVQAHEEVVYASPRFGGAMLAIGYAAKLYGKKATVFVAASKQDHPRTAEARALGVNIVDVPMGFLSNTQAKAKAYAVQTGAHYLEFGGYSERTLELIGSAAFSVYQILLERGEWVTEVWCASGSGVLTRGLQRGVVKLRQFWLTAGVLSWSPAFFCVQVGHKLTREEAGAATIVPALESSLAVPTKVRPPYPACPNYDAKAWDRCVALRKGRALLWNVMGPSPTPFLAEALVELVQTVERREV